MIQNFPISKPQDDKSESHDSRLSRSAPVFAIIVRRTVNFHNQFDCGARKVHIRLLV